MKLKMSSRRRSESHKMKWFRSSLTRYDKFYGFAEHFHFQQRQGEKMLAEKNSFWLTPSTMKNSRRRFQEEAWYEFSSAFSLQWKHRWDGRWVVQRFGWMHPESCGKIKNLQHFHNLILKLSLLWLHLMAQTVSCWAKFVVHWTRRLRQITKLIKTLFVFTSLWNIY